MARWVLALSLGFLALSARAQDTISKAPLPNPDLQTKRPTSGKIAVPPEEDKSFLKEEHTFNPLQSTKSVSIGDEYLHKGKVQAAANRYEDATLWNNGNAEAWLKLGKAEERLKDAEAARKAYGKYLEVAPTAKDAADIRKKLDKLKK